MARKADPEQKIIDASLKLAEERGWRRLTLPEIAEAAGLSLAALYRQFRSKQAILVAVSRKIDARLLEEIEGDLEMDEPARDRLFDVMMRRFDLLQPHRGALSRITYDQLNDPAALCGSLQQLSKRPVSLPPGSPGCCVSRLWSPSTSRCCRSGCVTKPPICLKPWPRSMRA